jgi:hypothetical protein
MGTRWDELDVGILRYLVQQISASFFASAARVRGLLLSVLQSHRPPYRLVGGKWRTPSQVGEHLLERL